MVGAALGYMRGGGIDALAVLLALGAALLMQLITNLQNDVGYTLRGGDITGTRIGLPRATSSGMLAPRTVRLAIGVLSFLAVCFGLGLVAYRGWPVLAMGAASLLAALAYMGGPKPIAYTPLGELTVLVFFGLVAVMGTDWLVTGTTDGLTALGAVAVGALAAAALAVNNHRDIAHDLAVGRSTFAARFGLRASRWLLGLLLCMPFGLSLLMSVVAMAPWLGLPWLLAPVAWRIDRDFVVCPGGMAFNGILFRVFQLTLGFSALLALGAALSAHPQAGIWQLGPT